MAIFSSKVTSYHIVSEYDPYATGERRYYVMATVEYKLFGFSLKTSNTIVSGPTIDHSFAKRRLKTLRDKLKQN